MPTTPGRNQPISASASTSKVFFSPRVSGPSLRRSSATYSSTPSTCFTSGRFMTITMTTTATNITTTIGSAIANHSTNVIGSPVSVSSSSRPIRLGGLPIGSRSPPTVML